MSVLIQGANGTVLYAICWQRWVRGVVVDQNVDFCHAKSRGDAKLQFLREKKYNRQYKILEAAPAVGVQAADDHGDRLVVL